MILHDQPSIFDRNVRAAVSSITDGTMKFGMERSAEVEQNRVNFLLQAGISIDEATLVAISYEPDADFITYRISGEHEKSAGMRVKSAASLRADALFVDTPNHALFLPIADCIGIILHDSKRQTLMVSHVGRHSIEKNGAEKSVEFMKNQGSSSSDIRVWLSPAVGSATYPLRAFNGASLHEVAVNQLQNAGVSQEHIECSPINTAESPDYFSHSEHLKGNGQAGRFAIVAQMTAQGEPAS